jgi:hypothetical protein
MASSSSNSEQRLEHLEAKLYSAVGDIQKLFAAMNSPFDQLMELGRKRSL